jgi:3'-phosphoadenosine 5'-phosphosulfate sulfotransferase (PAPS reductase)/FAD synthetase
MLIEAVRLYGREKVIAVFNDTGDDHDGSNRLLNWQGTHKFVIAECATLGVPLFITHRSSILELTERRGYWSDNKARLCTSTTKRDATDILLRHLAAGDLFGGGQLLYFGKEGSQTVIECLNEWQLTSNRPFSRILLLTGELVEESAARAKKPAWQIRQGVTAASLGRLVVWHRPQLQKTKAQEILNIWANGRDIAPMYRIGFDRLSCRFCFYLSFERMVLSFVCYPKDAADYVRLEEQINHKVNLNYFWDGEKGYMAVWRFCYGNTSLDVGNPTPLPRAIETVNRLHIAATDLINRIKTGEQDSWKKCGKCA